MHRFRRRDFFLRYRLRLVNRFGKRHLSGLVTRCAAGIDLISLFRFAGSYLEVRQRDCLESFLLNLFRANFRCGRLDLRNRRIFDDGQFGSRFRQRFRFRGLHRVLDLSYVQRRGDSGAFHLQAFIRHRRRSQAGHPMLFAFFGLGLSRFVRCGRHHVHPAADPGDKTRTAHFLGFMCCGCR